MRTPTRLVMVDVVVIGKNTEVSAPLREATIEKVDRIGRFASDVRRVEVDYSETRNRRVADSQTCEILVHVKGHLVKSHASAPDPFAALDLALGKIEHQLRRLHGRRAARRDSRRDGGPGRSGNGEVAVAPGEAPIAREVEGVEASSPDGSPTIVKTKQFAVKPMDPEEAALQMELLGHDFFLFTSSENGRAAVVYRRRDGHLGLIEASG